MTVETLGVTGYLSQSQSFIGDGNRKTVAFDVASTDDFGALLTTPGVFPVPEAGDYHVSTAVDTDASDFDLYLVVDTVEARRPSVANSATVSKTLRGLTDSQSITVEVSASSDFTVNSGKNITYVTIDKIG